MKLDAKPAAVVYQQKPNQTLEGFLEIKNGFFKFLVIKMPGL